MGYNITLDVIPATLTAAFSRPADQIHHLSHPRYYSSSHEPLSLELAFTQIHRRVLSILVLGFEQIRVLWVQPEENYIF